MEKILFVIPPHIKFEDFLKPSFNVRSVQKKNGKFGSVLTDMPLGVLSMSAYIKKYTKVKTKLVDFNVILNKLESFEYPTFKELYKNYFLQVKKSKYNPTIVGVSSLFTPSYQNVLDIAQCCRKIFPKAIIVAGGGVPTNLYKEIFQDNLCFDALCFGEGEKPLLGLVKAKNKLLHLQKHQSWITRKKVEKRETFRHCFINNLDEIPFYDYDILQQDDYGLNPALTAYASIGEKKQNFHVMTSRGCVHHCCFCSSHTVHGRQMRYFSVKRIREDFRRLRDSYGAKTLVFQDDHLMADKKRAYEIIEIIKELKVRVVFQNSLALYALDRKFLEALRGAGVDQLLLSVESGSDRVLREIMHKPLNLSIVKQVAEDCRDLGIYTNVNILIGLPGETKKDIEKTRTFLKTIYSNWFLIFCATPLVGSEMFDICKKKKYLKGNYIYSDYKKAVVETEDFSARYIQETAYLLNLDLNFVNNSDMRLGNYEMALKGFENAIRAKSDHAIAYYYAAKCYKQLGNNIKAREYKKSAITFAKNPFWRKYTNMLGVSELK